MMRAFALAMLVIACLSIAPAYAAKPPKPLLIEHVTVLPMTAGGEPLRDATVIIENGRITSVDTEHHAFVPRGGTRMDATGMYLLPGFTDMHVHLQNDRLMRLWTGDATLPDGTVNLEEALTPYLANGVTQIFNLTAMSEAVGQRVEVESGRVSGPHIANAAMIDGSPPSWPLGMLRAAATPEDGRQAVRDAHAEGHQFIKAYGKLSLETFSAVVDAARQRSMRVIGHIPQRGQNLTGKFFQPGFDLVAHAEEYAQQTTPPATQSIPRYADMAKRNGTWLVATLSLDERILEAKRDPDSLTRRTELRYLPPGEHHVVFHDNPYLEDTGAGSVRYVQDIVDFNRELVKAFVAAGIPVLTGTDSPVPGVVPGFSLHDEFVALNRAGMSNQQVLEATTRLPAEWLGTLGDRGTVEAGKRADLVLLDANPLVDIANTRRIHAVIIGGRMFDRALIDRKLAQLAARNPSR
jgi:imidazolonepropionase-like amidohydrolase